MGVIKGFAITITITINVNKNLQGINHLENYIRQKLHTIVYEHPGISLSEIAKQMKCKETHILLLINKYNLYRVTEYYSLVIEGLRKITKRHPEYGYKTLSYKTGMDIKQIKRYLKQENLPLPSNINRLKWAMKKYPDYSLSQYASYLNLSKSQIFRIIKEFELYDEITIKNLLLNYRELQDDYREREHQVMKATIFGKNAQVRCITDQDIIEAKRVLYNRPELIISEEVPHFRRKKCKSKNNLRDYNFYL